MRSTVCSFPGNISAIDHPSFLYYMLPGLNNKFKLVHALLTLQRDTVQAASEFAARNQLPGHIEDQMLSHICLRFKTEELKQQETLDSLPKAIRSSISSFLFFPIVQQVYLFQGVSFYSMSRLVRAHVDLWQRSTRLIPVPCSSRLIHSNAFEVTGDGNASRVLSFQGKCDIAE